MSSHLSRQRRSLLAFAVAVAMGVALAVVKGDSTGVRGALGNLSAPWLLIGMYAGFATPTLRRAAATGLAATGVALVAFYAVLTVVLAGRLGSGTVPQEFATELNANRVYLLFAVCAGPIMGMAGWWLRGRPAWAPIAAGMALAGELVVVAVVHGRQLLPPPVYFAWAVDDWRPYVAECIVGVALAMSGLWRLKVRS